MFNLFSDIFTYRVNWLTGLDPRVKLVTAISFIIAVLLSGTIVFPLCVFSFSLALMLTLGFPARIVVSRVLIPAGIVSVLFVLKMFMTPGEVLWSFHAGPFSLSVTDEGLRAGVILASRVAGAVSMVLLLGMVTPAHDIFRALLWMKVSHVWVEIAMLMYRYIFVLMDAASDMATAQKLRLGYSDSRKALQSVGVLSGAVLLRSIDQAERTNEAMLLRGYNGTIPVGKLPPLKRSDALLMLSLPAFLAAACLLLEKVF